MIRPTFSFASVPGLTRNHLELMIMLPHIFLGSVELLSIVFSTSYPTKINCNFCVLPGFPGLGWRETYKLINPPCALPFPQSFGGRYFTERHNPDEELQDSLDDEAHGHHGLLFLHHGVIDGLQGRLPDFCFYCYNVLLTNNGTPQGKQL